MTRMNATVGDRRYKNLLAEWRRGRRWPFGFGSGRGRCRRGGSGDRSVKLTRSLVGGWTWLGTVEIAPHNQGVTRTLQGEQQQQQSHTFHGGDANRTKRHCQWRTRQEPEKRIAQIDCSGDFFAPSGAMD